MHTYLQTYIFHQRTHIYLDIHIYIYAVLYIMISTICLCTCRLFTVARDFQITQCRVSKQILIHKLSPVLILQMKRFTIGSHNVTKDNRHVSFPRVLNMAPYCTTECLEVCSESLLCTCAVTQ